MSREYDYLIVGSGVFGAVFANQAVSCGKKVLVVEKRSHIGGNVYTEKSDGIIVHKYGPHIFHTSNEEVWNYINQFADFNSFVNMPKANYKGEIYSLPFNMNTFEEMWGVTEPAEAQAIITSQQSSVTGEPKNLEEKAISLVGKDIFEKLIKGYTEKQWGKECSQLPATIIERIPVRFTYDNNYFSDQYQGIPVGGYTPIIEKMLDGAEVKTDTDYFSDRQMYDQIADTIIFTGPIDAFFEYKLGHLEYRTIEYQTEHLDINDYQHNAVVNYTDNETPYTRIIEHKWFTFGKDDDGVDLPNTIISKEYSKKWSEDSEPYYPINDQVNESLYLKYAELGKNIENVYFGGRLGEYKYYDMDKTILSALSLARKLLK